MDHLYSLGTCTNQGCLSRPFPFSGAGRRCRWSSGRPLRIDCCKPREGGRDRAQRSAKKTVAEGARRAGQGCLPDGDLEIIDTSLPVRSPPNVICLKASPPGGIDLGRSKLVPKLAALSRLVTFMLTSFAESGASPYLASSFVGGMLPYGGRRAVCVASSMMSASRVRHAE